MSAVVPLDASEICSVSSTELNANFILNSMGFYASFSHTDVLTAGLNLISLEIGFATLSIGVALRLWG